MSNLSQLPFYDLVVLGLIDGAVSAPLVVGVGNVLLTFSDVSDFGNITFPTGAESWELVSANANDTSAGTGARTVFFETFDANSVLQTPQIVSTNGGTVALTGTHFRTRAQAVLTAGTVKGTNIGNLTLQVSGGGNVRSTTLAGNGVPFDSFYHVPAGKVAVVKQTATWVGKGEDAIVRSMNFDSSATNGATNVGGPIPVYQNSVIYDIYAGAIPEKYDFWTQAKSLNVSADVNTASQIIEYDAAELGVTMASISLRVL